MQHKRRHVWSSRRSEPLHTWPTSRLPPHGFLTCYLKHTRDYQSRCSSWFHPHHSWSTWTQLDKRGGGHQSNQVLRSKSRQETHVAAHGPWSRHEVLAPPQGQAVHL